MRPSTGLWHSSKALISCPAAVLPRPTHPPSRIALPVCRYVPEERNIKSIRSIQTEETAVKELSKLYGAGNVRIVPRERKAPGLPPPGAKH